MSSTQIFFKNIILLLALTNELFIWPFQGLFAFASPSLLLENYPNQSNKGDIPDDTITYFMLTSYVIAEPLMDLLLRAYPLAPSAKFNILASTVNIVCSWVVPPLIKEYMDRVDSLPGKGEYSATKKTQLLPHPTLRIVACLLSVPAAGVSAAFQGYAESLTFSDVHDSSSSEFCIFIMSTVTIVFVGMLVVSFRCQEHLCRPPSLLLHRSSRSIAKHSGALCLTLVARGLLRWSVRLPVVAKAAIPWTQGLLISSASDISEGLGVAGIEFSDLLLVTFLGTSMALFPVCLIAGLVFICYRWAKSYLARGLSVSSPNMGVINRSG